MSTYKIVIEDQYRAVDVGAQSTSQRVKINSNELVAVKIGSVPGIQGIAGRDADETLYVPNSVTSSFLRNYQTSSMTVENALTASFYNVTGFVASTETGSLATTGSNTFHNNQIITGSLIVSGATSIYGNTIIGNSLSNNHIISGTIFIAGDLTITDPSPIMTFNTIAGSQGYIAFQSASVAKGYFGSPVNASGLINGSDLPPYDVPVLSLVFSLQALASRS